MGMETEVGTQHACAQPPQIQLGGQGFQQCLRITDIMYLRMNAAHAHCQRRADRRGQAVKGIGHAGRRLERQALAGREQVTAPHHPFGRHFIPGGGFIQTALDQHRIDQTQAPIRVAVARRNAVRQVKLRIAGDRLHTFILQGAQFIAPEGKDIFVGQVQQAERLT